MNRCSMSLAFVLILVLAFAPVASAHTPIGAGSNERLASATLIPDSTKSWAVYTDLHEGGEAQYYKFAATKGEKIPITLYTSPSKQDAAFLPGFVLIGPGIANQGAVPSYVETPAGAGHRVVKGTRPAHATYEAFAPSSFVQVADIVFEAPAAGTYYVAVQNDERGGHYGVAIGEREASTVYEWIVNPLAFPSIYAWERQSLLLVFAPAFLLLALGLGLLFRRHRWGQRLDSAGWMAASASLLFMGSGVTVASQMAVSLLRSPADALVIFTVLFAALPVLFGVLALRLAVRRSGHWNLRSRIYLALLSVAALVFWAGWLVGSGLAIAAAFVPAKAAQASMPRGGA